MRDVHLGLGLCNALTQWPCSGPLGQGIYVGNHQACEGMVREDTA